MGTKNWMVILLGAAALTACGREVLVSFTPDAKNGRSCIERYTVDAQGVWHAAGVWREKPATSLAAFGDGWAYTAGGRFIGRFRKNGTPDDGPYVKTPEMFWSLAVSPDNRWFYCSQFNNQPGSWATVMRYLVSDPKAGGVYLSRDRTPNLHLETARQLAFGKDGLLYVGCRGNAPNAPRSGVVALDVRGAQPREVAFYPMPGAMAGFAFDPDERLLVVHGRNRGRVFRLGDTAHFRNIESGLSNSFCAMRMAGAWYCGDYTDGEVKRVEADGTFRTVANLRPGITALLCLDDVGEEIPRTGGVEVGEALCGPYERLKYNSRGTCDLKVGLWAFPLPMDLNADGIDDLVVSTPDTPWGGTFFFAGTKEGVFKAPVRIGGERHWNMSCSEVDGEPVVMTPERTFWDFRRNGFGENELCEQVHRAYGLRTVMWRYADLDGDGRADRVAFHGGGAMWEKCLTRPGPGAKYAAPEPLRDETGKVRKSMGTLGDLADLDGDGDLDVVFARGNDGFAWMENVGSRTTPRFGPQRVLKDTTGADLHTFVCMNVPCCRDWDRDGRPDILAGDEDGRVHWFRNAGARDAQGNPVFEPARAFRQERADLGQGVLVAPSACDWDGDGDLDLICGDSAGSLTFIENLSGAGVERPSWAEPRALSCEGAGGIPSEHATNNPIRLMAGRTGSIQGPGEAKWGYTSPVVIDWDGDGVLDVLENSVWGYVYWHRNLGTKTSPRLGPATPIEVEWDGAQPALAWGANKPKGKELMTQWRTTPLGTDWDDDGLPDLVMLDREGYLALFRRTVRNNVRVLLPPAHVFIDEATGLPIRLNPGAAGRSGRRKLCTMDWDGDGRKDFFVSSSLYHQHEHGVSVDFWRQTRAEKGVWYFRNEGRLSPSRLHGHSCAPTPVDFNADGVPDILVGGEDGFFYYLRNPRTKK